MKQVTVTVTSEAGGDEPLASFTLHTRTTGEAILTMMNQLYDNAFFDRTAFDGDMTIEATEGRQIGGDDMPDLDQWPFPWTLGDE